MADNVVGIKFGVLGGVDGESAKFIQKQLSQIAEKINLQVKVNVNKTHFKESLADLKKDLNDTLGTLPINVKAISSTKNGTASSGTAAAKEQIASYSSLTKIVDKLYQAKVKLAKLTEFDKTGTINGSLISTNVQELERSYTEQLKQLKELLGVDDERVKKIEQYRAELEKIYQDQKGSISPPKIASPVSTSKIQVKAQSLYTDNGFDDIIARSQKARDLVDQYQREVNEKLSQANGATKEDIDELNKKFLDAQTNLKQIGRESDTVGSKIKEAFDSRVVQRIANVILLLLIRQLKQVYNIVKEINTAMTDLQIVTGATAKQMEAAANNIAKSAQKIGTGIADLTNSTSTYARLGYSLNDAQTLAEKTTIYAKVAGVNVSEATTNITGIIKAFNIGADGLEAVLDQLIFVGNNFPISQAEIGEAMNNAASALAANGNTLQQSIGIVSAANTTLQNISKSSTAVRTIAARISSSTSELEELGESIDDLEAFPELANKMRGYGIEITDANGQLLSTYDILGKVAGQWENFNRNEQAAIATMLAGTRQQAAFYSIMQNWGDAQEIVAKEGEASGALMDAQAIRLDSIEGKLEQLNATFESFSQNLLDSDIVKFIIDGLNVFVSGLDWIIDKVPVSTIAIGGLILVIGKLGQKLGLLTKKLWDNVNAWKAEGQKIDSIKQKLSDYQNQLAANTAKFNDLPLGKSVSMNDLMDGFDVQKIDEFNEKIRTSYGLSGENAQAVTEWAKQQRYLTLQVEQTTKDLKAAELAQSNYVASLISGATTILTLLASLFNASDSTASQAASHIIMLASAVTAAILAKIFIIDKAMKANVIFAAISLAISAIIGLIDLIKKVAPTFDNLKEKAKEFKDTWEEAKGELDEVKDKIKEVQDSIDELNSKEKLSIVDQQDLNRLQQELSLLKQEEAFKQEETISAQRDAINAAEEAIDKYKRNNTIIDENGNVIQSFDEKITNALKNYYNSSDREWALETIKQYSELLDGFEYGMNQKLNSYFDEYYKFLDMYTIASDSAGSAWSSIISRVNNQEAVKSLKEFSDTFKDTSKITGESLRELAQQKPEVQKLFDYLKTIGMWDGENWDNLTQLVGNMRTKLAELASVDLIDDIETVTDKFDSLNDALSAVTKNGILSLKALSTLTEKYPSLLNKYFNKTLNGYVVSDSYSKYIKDSGGVYKKYSEMSNYEILQDMAIASLSEYQKALETAKTTLAGLSKEDDDYETALKNLATAQDNLNTKEIEWASLLRESAIDDRTQELDAMQDTLETQLDRYKDIIDLRKELLKTYQEEVNYQKELAQKQKSVADLQTQLSLAKLDKSASGQARVRELENQLQDAQDALDQYTLERAVQDVTASIDDEYNEYEKFVREQIEGIEAQIGDIAKTLSDILTGVEGLSNTEFTGKEMYDLYTDLKNKQNDGMSLSNEAQQYMGLVGSGNYAEADKLYAKVKSESDNYQMKNPIGGVELTEDQKLAQKFTLVPNAWGRGIAASKEGDNGIVTFNGKEYHVENGGIASGLIKAAYQPGYFGDRDIFVYDGELYGCLDGSVVKLRATDGWHNFWSGVGDSNNYNALKASIRAMGIYHTGGFVGNVTDLKSNEEFAKLLNGEFVSTPKQMDVFMKKTLPAIVEGSQGKGATINNNSPLVEIKCGDVNESSLPKLKTLVDQAVKKIEQNMESALSRTGYKKR